TETLASVDNELHDLSAAEEVLQTRLTGMRSSLEQKQQERERLRRVGDETVSRISQLRQNRSGLVSRSEVLEGLIRGHEGLGAGVREVFALIERPEPGPWGTV